MDFKYILLICLALVVGYYVLRYWRRRGRRKRLLSEPIRPEWKEILEKHVPLYSRMPARLQIQLEGLVNLFIAEKRFEGCNGLEITDEIKVTIAGQAFELWIADDVDEQQKGLMFVTAEQMAPLADGTERGMIFVFEFEQRRYFWMRNTVIPLDIAYLDSNGIIVSTHTMAPLDTRLGQYPSGAPARYAVEVNANVFQRLGVKAGDRIEIPDSLLNPAP